MQSMESFRSRADPERQEAYADFMEGCFEAFGAETCAKHEKDRLASNAIQPALMRNLTATGYAKVRMPTQVFDKLRDHIFHYQENLVPESWGSQTYMNHWKEESDIHNLEHFMALSDRQLIQQQVQHVLEDWCGVPLTPTSLYGIRIYRHGAVLAPHVDRLPLVVSAILQVAQDEVVDQDWPLEVIGRNGVAVNVTLQPGEMLLYESASIIHGRPYALQSW
jgi:prolyl 4-hydroxylase